MENSNIDPTDIQISSAPVNNSQNINPPNKPSSNKSNKGLIIAFLVILAVIGFILLSNRKTANNNQPVSISNQRATPLPSSQNKSSNSYLIGIGYFPLNNALSDTQAMEKISESADIAFIQRHWKESLNSNNRNFYEEVNEETKEARNKGLKVYLAFEILSSDRSRLELPANLKGNFSDKKVQEEYLATVKKAAGLQPDYFILNVEANRYQKYNPQDYQAFKTLYPQAYDIVKSVSPQTKVAVSIAYEDYNDKNCFDSEDENQLKNKLNDFVKSDLLAVSIYPTCYFNPAAIPGNFITQMANVSQLPLFISETGWMSESFDIASNFTFQSNQTDQAEYIEKLIQSSDLAVKQGKKIEAINYISILDPDTQTCQTIKNISPALGWYCTLALMDNRGQPKSAFQKMKDWKSSL